MFNRLKCYTQKAKRKLTEKMISAQTKIMCEKDKYDSRAGRAFLAGCAALSGAISPAFAADAGNAGDTTANIANAIRTSVGNAYGAMKTVGVVVAVCGVIVAAFCLFTGGDKGMEKAKKTLLYTVIGCAILFLAVPIVNFISGLFSDASADFDQLVT